MRRFRSAGRVSGWVTLLSVLGAANLTSNEKEVSMSKIEDIHKSYRFDQSPERVFEAWTSSDTVVEPVTRHEVDLRVGGKIRLFIETEEMTSVMEGEFKEISKPDKLIYTWEWVGSGEVTTVEVRFEATEGGTEVTVVHTGFTSQDSKETHDSGWDSYLEQLAERL